MKRVTIFVFTILALAMCTKQIDSIEIKHVGISDKPISTVLISTQKNEQANIKNYVIDNQILSNLKAIIKDNFDNITTFNKGEFGNFEVTIQIQGSKDLIYFFERKKSIQLFDKMIVELLRDNKNEELILELKNLKNRISF